MDVHPHRRTPSVVASDSRGLAVRLVEYLRIMADDTATALVTRHHYDVAGRLVGQSDPRLAKANTASVYDLNGESLAIANVDAGWRLSLPGLAGQILQLGRTR